MGGEDFWGDSDRAAAISAEHSRTSKRLETFTALEADVEDLDGLVEVLGGDEEDPPTPPPDPAHAG